VVYADVRILVGSVLTIRKNADFLPVASKEGGLEANADKTKYMVMSRDQNAGRNHVIKNVNRAFERVEQFRCLGTTLTYQNSIQEEIKRRPKSGNACCRSGAESFVFQFAI